jgi:hypothetical protein
VLAALLAVAGCSRGPRAPVIIDPELADLVPPDTVALAGLRLDALRNTPVWRKWVVGKPVAPLDELARDTGLDLRQDVSEALLASNGKDGVVLVHGRFNRVAWEAGLEKRGGKRMPYRGVTLVGGEDAAAAVLSASVAVAGPARLVRSVIDQRLRRGGAPRALLEQAQGIAGDSQLWVVSLGGLGQAAQVAPEAGNLANLAKIAEMIEKSSFAADLRTGLNASAVLQCRGEQEAQTLHDALRGILGLARLSTPDSEPDLLRVWDAVQISREQRAVRVRAQVAPELLDKLLGKLTAGGGTSLTPGFPL